MRVLHGYGQSVLGERETGIRVRAVDGSFAWRREGRLRAVPPVDDDVPRRIVVRIGERRPVQREEETYHDAFVRPRGHDGRLSDYDVVGDGSGRAAVVRDREGDRVRAGGGVMVRWACPAPRGAVPEGPLLARDRAVRIAARAREGAVQLAAVLREL